MNYDLCKLEDVIAFTARAHAGQTDKAGEPYILHPLRVMLRMTTRETRLAAVLHDVIEDTAYTADDLRALGCPEDVIQAVLALSRRPDEDYFDFVRRAAAHPIARPVKLADLEDNMNLTRLPHVTEKDRQRLARYREAWELLRE
ncbi:MAG: Bifunctional (p)ppGpp synthase/hydrolase SpoT [bacterium ADurb.Bin429]|nr:MAG: Bifunctional (p)ppGpp synthase/hydrolase SpoT [bacterium ADurb.Bin429]